MRSTRQIWASSPFARRYLGNPTSPSGRGNPKFQIPNNKQFSNSNFQIPKYFIIFLVIGIWCLEFIWDLVLGAWNFLVRRTRLLLVSFPPATEMFHFAGFASPTNTCGRCLDITPGGFPHSEIPGSTVARHLPRAYRSHATSFIASRPRGIHHLPINNPGSHLRFPYLVFKELSVSIKSLPTRHFALLKDRLREAVFLVANCHTLY